MGRQSATRSARGNREIISEGRKYDGLLELLTRLQVISLANEHSYQMPLTQALVGDALGLSVPHVSRTLRRLAEEDLVAIDKRC